HQNRIPDDGDIIELIDQRLQQLVGKLIDLGQLGQAGRPDDDIAVLDLRLIDATDVLLQAKGAKASARRLVLWLLDFDAALGLPLALHPERKSHCEKRMQADQIAGVQNQLTRALEVSIKLP